DGIRYRNVTGVQTCALPNSESLDPLFGELRSDHATNVIGLDDLGQVHRIGQERSPHSTSLVIAAYPPVARTQTAELPTIQCWLRSEERRVGKEHRSRGRGER